MIETKLIEFKRNGDERGYLVAIEQMKDIPFDIKRVFYIYGSDKNIIRGEHANRKSNFVLINVSGSCKITVDDGKNKDEYILNTPNVGLYIPAMVWKYMHGFSKDSVLLCLASEHYDCEEYITKYDDFLKEVNGDDWKDENEFV